MQEVSLLLWLVDRQVVVGVVLDWREPGRGSSGRRRGRQSRRHCGGGGGVVRRHRLVAALAVLHLVTGHRHHGGEGVSGRDGGYSGCFLDTGGSNLQPFFFVQCCCCGVEVRIIVSLTKKKIARMKVVQWLRVSTRTKRAV